MDLQQIKIDLAEQRNLLDEKNTAFDTAVENRDVESAKKIKEELEAIQIKINELAEKVAELEVKQEETEEETDEQETQEEETEENSEERNLGGNTQMETRQILDTEGDINMEQRAAFIKVLQGKANAEERELVQGGVGEDGGYLVPTEEKTSIDELKRSYKSAKDLTNVMQVSTLSGSYAAEDGTLTELVNFDEDNAGLDDTDSPKFKQVEWKVNAYGAIVP